MPLEPEKITREHVEKAIERIKDEEIDLIPSTGYDVIIDGEKYPPKDVMRYAHEEMNGEHIWKKGGGESTNKYLKKMGFEIVKKNEQMDYFDIDDGLKNYQSKVGEMYNAEDEAAEWWKDTRQKLNYLVKKLSGRLNEGLEINYSELPLKRSGPGRIEFKDYVITGFKPKFITSDDFLFIKLAIHNLDSDPIFDIEIDGNWKLDDQIFDTNDISEIKEMADFSIPINKSFPNSWKELTKKLEAPIKNAIETYTDFYAERSKEEKFSSIENLDLKFKHSLNKILYGPPGTGKTFSLRHKYAPHFTQSKKLKTKKEYEGEIIESMSWWEVVAMVLLDEGDLTVPEIKDHRFTKIKENISNTKSLHATLWGQLQTHTSPDSQNVNTSNRQEPFIFEKKEDSVWTINMENCRQKTPYLLEHLDKMENYTSELNERQNYRFTTFHQSFTYEDFVEGIKPVLHEESDETNDGELGYRIEKGIFYQAADEACKLAGFLGLQDCLNHTDEERKSNFSEATPFALFIDEINRGNISAILGELITLIEQDKRLTKENELIVRLPYSKSKFAVPPNLYILGTLNTADRSVEALDTALRRRFSFEEIEPNPELLSGVIVEDIDIQKMLDQINLRIEKLLDRDHRIGHSYFLPLKKNPNLNRLKYIFADRIIPLLKEYFFGDFGKIGLVLGRSFVEEVQSDGAAIFAEFPGYEDIAAEYDERKVFKISSAENWNFKSIYIPKTDVE